MIVTIQVKWEQLWSCEIELKETSSLAELHHVIQGAVEFDNDHHFDFFIGRTRRSRGRKFLCDEEAGCDIAVKDLFPLPPKMQLFYLFDFGANWIFKISRTRKPLHPPVDNVSYPRVVQETGEKPQQYGYVD